MKKLIFLFFIVLNFNAFGQEKTFVYEMSYRPKSAKDSLKTEKMLLDVSGQRSIFRTEQEKSTTPSWRRRAMPILSNSVLKITYMSLKI